ncbi:helix-turn-helix domain-containing protein [Streptomyces roseirectus]|uniref:Helix-turn-helix domain-containing protein n=1 Tax=Streptomyces roseirectus TaxID=2768066 RepID=A0A7H0III3_9ACTN|nr:helix-turn-helix transcriptional regulator [Streptomyces roseirectus]QNP72599.1 helix-turn-helix domain-containing protein [Streptomyces roseirectus]
MPQRLAVTGLSQEPRKRFAQELRRLREERKETLQQLAAQLGWDASTFGKLESGRNLGSPDIVEALDHHYGTTPWILILWELALGDERRRGKLYRQPMAHERQSVSLCYFSSSILPGLLQTPGYTRELFAVGGIPSDRLEAEVAFRMARQEILLGDDAPLFRAEWHKQLEHLLHMSEHSNIAIQVLPFSTRLHPLTNTEVFIIHDGDGKAIVWVESGYFGAPFNDTKEVKQYQLRYDQVRDLAYSPSASREFIKQLLEETPQSFST